MFDTRLNMAATWVWWHRQRNRKLGEPVVDPFEQQPEDVTEPVNWEVSEVIRALDVYDSTRDIIRVDLRLVKDVTLKLYKTFHPELTPSVEELESLEGSVKIMLHHLRIEGDAPADREQVKD